MVKKRPEKIQALFKIQPITKLIQTSVSFLNKFPHLAMVCEQLDIGHEQNKFETYPILSWIIFPSIFILFSVQSGQNNVVLVIWWGVSSPVVSVLDSGSHCVGLSPGRAVLKQDASLTLLRLLG